MASLADKVFAVTGGASGMGLATCKRLIQYGAKAVCIGDYNTSALEEVSESLRAMGSTTKILTTQFDGSSQSNVTAWFAELIENFGALDGLVDLVGVARKVNACKAPFILEETDET